MVTMLAAYPTSLHLLADFDTTTQLGHDETLAVGVKRVAMRQFEDAAGGFFDGEAAFPEAVHELRKSMKRVRSLLRLVRDEIGEKIYRFEDASIGGTARLMAEPRSATATVLAAAGIRDLYGELLAEGTFEDLLARLEQRRDVIHVKTMEDPTLVSNVVRNLEKAYGRYGSWPTDPDAREVYGAGIRDRYQSVGPGLRRTYDSGRRRMVAAYARPTSENFHGWRKSAKYLRHQMEFLAPLWPEVIVGTAMTLERVGGLLGEDHDYADLIQLLRERPDLCPNPRERSLFLALVGQRRAELRVAAEILGRRVYAEKAASFHGRFGEYWESRQLALNASLDTLVAY
jgi:CHAD domain-containing protein